ncbi:MAG: hypothetical protein KAS32_22520 [Candidatus Peribacteraceae bacterium]|nr:hypothetical protein [Candidatus Peribacteraceae bacterium]
MKVEYKDYIMEAQKEGGFHLRKKVVSIKKKNGDKYDNENEIGYNMSLASCIRKIIHLEMCENDGTYNLKEIVDLWNNKCHELEKLIKL